MEPNVRAAFRSTEPDNALSRDGRNTLLGRLPVPGPEAPTMARRGSRSTRGSVTVGTWASAVMEILIVGDANAPTDPALRIFG